MVDRYLAAVDGGGSNTVLSLYSKKTKKTIYHRTGPTNYKVVGAEITRHNLITELQHWLKGYHIDMHQIDHFVFGISGLDNESDALFYRQLIESLSITEAEYTLCNDAEIAFYTVGELPGVIVVAGTGSIAFAMTAEGQYRSGGWGSPFSDLGSGVWLGNKLLTSMLKYCDGGGVKETIYEACLKKASVEAFEDFPMAVTDIALDQVALYAKLVLSHADEGDDFCQSLVQEAAKELSFLVESAAQKARFAKTQGYDCVLSGGLFNSLYFKQSLMTALQNSEYHWEMKHYTGFPVDGGIHLAQLKNIDK